MVASTITSLQNPRIKRVVRLANRQARDEAGQTVVEGVREVRLALGRGIVPVEAYLCPELIAGEEGESAARHLATLAGTGMTELFYVTPAVFEKIAYRGESGGLLLVIPYSRRSLRELDLPAVPFLVIVEEAEKPGNLGAVLRTADGAGVHAVIVSHDAGSRGTDLHNPNVIRASLGAYFTVPTFSAPPAELIPWLRARGIAIVAATPAAEQVYTDADLTGPLAMAVGSEAWGLSDAWLAAADVRVRIPMLGQVDSLNLSTAAGLLIYEVLRQRRSGNA